MQGEKSLQFWDDYHSQNDSQEWISEPLPELLDMLVQRYYESRSQNSDNNEETGPQKEIYLLEVGCGTSTLVRDLKARIETYQQTLLDQSTSASSSHPPIVYACGTDVSPICVDSNRQRDKDFINSHPGSDENRSMSSQLQYEVLNVVEPGDSPCHRNAWDLILDKGCLDTFLFRCRQRGGGGKNSFSPLLRTVLDNVHSWMAPKACYMLITPRAKLKAVRNYAGFASVQRYQLPVHFTAELEGKDADDNSTCVYLYICLKNQDYIPGESMPFCEDDRQNLPQDDSTCTRCGITFYAFRKGESMSGKGATFWNRQWKGHCAHCKINT